MEQTPPAILGVPFETMISFFVVAAGVLGLIFGSFATAVAYRLPRNESISSGRSKCPSCGSTITAIQNVPLFSYVVLRGKCKHCGNRISIRYPLIELTTGVLFAAAVARFGLSVEAVLYAGFFWALVVLTVIDLEYRLLPNKIVFPLVVATYLAFAAAGVVRGDAWALSPALVLGAVGLTAVIAVMTWPAPEPVSDADEQEEPEAEPLRDLLFGVVALVAWVALLVLGAMDGPLKGFRGAVVGGALFSLLLLGVAMVGSVLSGRTAMGGGDIKLATGLGAVLGYLEAPGAVVVGIFLSFLSGGVLSIGILLASGDRKRQIPFGPFLALGTVLGVFLGEPLLDAYLGTF